MAKMPEPGVLRRSGEIVAYVGLNPSHQRSGTSIDPSTRISKIGNAELRSALYMPALSAMRFNPAVASLVARLKSPGCLKPRQIVVAAMRKLLVLCFGVSSRLVRHAEHEVQPSAGPRNPAGQSSLGQEMVRRRSQFAILVRGREAYKAGLSGELVSCPWRKRPFRSAVAPTFEPGTAWVHR
jgi:hypothetical protein